MKNIGRRASPDLFWLTLRGVFEENRSAGLSRHICFTFCTHFVCVLRQPSRDMSHFRHIFLLVWPWPGPWARAVGGAGLRPWLGPWPGPWACGGGAGLQGGLGCGGVCLGCFAGVGVVSFLVACGSAGSLRCCKSYLYWLGVIISPQISKCCGMGEAIKLYIVCCFFVLLPPTNLFMSL